MKDLHQLIIIVDGQIEHISTHHGEDAAGDAGGADGCAVAVE